MFNIEVGHSLTIKIIFQKKKQSDNIWQKTRNEKIFECKNKVYFLTNFKHGIIHRFLKLELLLRAVQNQSGS